MSEEKETAENREQIQSLKLEGNQAAVIAEILSQYVAPASQSKDNAWANTLLELTQWTDSLICSWSLYGENRITQTDESASTITVIKPSNLALDRLCAAWFHWRVKHYRLPTEEDSSLGVIEDNPF